MILVRRSVTESPGSRAEATPGHRRLDSRSTDRPRSQHAVLHHGRRRGARSRRGRPDARRGASCPTSSKVLSRFNPWFARVLTRTLGGVHSQGFRDELEEIISAAPRSRQTLLFSATVTESIQQLTRLSMNKPVRVKIDEMGAAAKGLEQECAFASLFSPFLEAVAES